MNIRSNCNIQELIQRLRVTFSNLELPLELPSTHVCNHFISPRQQEYPWNYQIYDCILEGLQDKCIELIDKSVTVQNIDEIIYVVNRYDGTLLMQAVYNNCARVVKHILKKGANPDFTVINLTPLQVSIVYNYEDIFHILIEHGADMHAGDIGAALHYAIDNKRYEMVRHLVFNKADINQLEVFGSESMTPFSLSMKNYTKKDGCSRQIAHFLLSTFKVDFSIPINCRYLHLLEIDTFNLFIGDIAWKRRKHCILLRRKM